MSDDGVPGGQPDWTFGRWLVLESELRFRWSCAEARALRAETTLAATRTELQAVKDEKSTAYREGYEAGQKAGLIFGSSQPDLASLQNAERCGYANGEAAGIRATEEKCERVNRELRESLDKRDAAIRALHQEAEERIHEGATRATECDAWRDKCGALEEALKVADSRALDLENRLATAQKQARIDERHLRECLARTEQERYQAACERNRAEAELRTLREKLAALLNEKA
jgi:chromosome segregation ATPase